MNKAELGDLYRAYIACLNGQNWSKLGQFVHGEASYNGKQVGLSGYRAMLEQDFRDIPDLRFDIELIVCEPPIVASRLAFDCTPKGEFLGIGVNGRRVAFCENVFYVFSGGKIHEVWSIVDRLAIERQLSAMR